MKSKRTLVAAAFMLVALFTVGAGVIMAGQGDSDDPLVTKSYIDSVVLPEVTKTIDKSITERKAEFDALVSQKLAEHLKQVDAKVSGAQGGSGITLDTETVKKITDQAIAQLKAEGINTSGQWQVVNVPNGKVLKVPAGSELLVRVGSATAWGGLIVNITDGNELAANGTLKNDSLYMVTSKDRGIKATKDCIVMVSGGYTIA